MARKGWVYDPHSGGVKIPKAVQERTRFRIIAYAEKNFSGKFTRIDVQFRGALGRHGCQAYTVDSNAISITDF